MECSSARIFSGDKFLFKSLSDTAFHRAFAQPEVARVLLEQHRGEKVAEEVAAGLICQGCAIALAVALGSLAVFWKVILCLAQAGQRPLELRRSAKHLVVDLPTGSREGIYDFALLSNTGDQLLSATGTAQLQDHVVVLRTEVDFGDVRPGVYFLALRQPGLEWARYPVRVF